MRLTRRDWVPRSSEDLVQKLAREASGLQGPELIDHVEMLARRNREIHECDCFNLNPATNVLNPRAEELLSAGLGSRPSLGYPGDKYETGLEAIEEIEFIAAMLAAEIFDARFAEIRVASGAMANLYAFMATCQPGDTIIAPPATIGGHVTHHGDGCAGLYGLRIAEAPVDPDGYTLDLAEMRYLLRDLRPRLVTIGGSLNLYEHPVAEIRALCDEVGAYLLFDAAHQCGIIAGGAWANPLTQGAHLMTMSTYKSLGGPAGGLIVTNEADLAQRLDAIAFPGMTANFDAGKVAALAVTLTDWRDHGAAYAAKMIEVAQALAEALSGHDLPVFTGRDGATNSHQFALRAAEFGGGQTASRSLRRAGFLACGIGLPVPPVPGDMNGLRMGTPELVRWGVDTGDVPGVAALIAEALTAEPEAVAPRTKALRAGFDRLHYIT